LAETNVLSTNHSPPFINSQSEISKSNNSEVNKNENKPIQMNMNSSKKERNDWLKDKTLKMKNKKNKLAMENTGHLFDFKTHFSFDIIFLIETHNNF